MFKQIISVALGGASKEEPKVEPVDDFVIRYSRSERVQQFSQVYWDTREHHHASSNQWVSS
ncbi:MAG: hypothetical protein ACO1Q7_18535 [Gemmatimonas sp.]